MQELLPALGTEIFTVRQSAQLVCGPDGEVSGVEISKKLVGPLTITKLVVEVDVNGTHCHCLTDPSWGIIPSDEICLTKAEAEDRI
jgi:hypothetical protein